MWFLRSGLIHELRGLPPARERFLTLCMLEQGICDAALANSVQSCEGLIRACHDLRELATRVAGLFDATPDAGMDAATLAVADAAAAIELDSIGGSGALPALKCGRRKWWPMVPECLSIHWHSLHSMEQEIRCHAAELTAPAGDVLVVGVRTSGSVMAPLVTALFRAAGRRSEYVTVRPLAARDRSNSVTRDDEIVADAGVREALQAWRGRVIVVDDPPKTGTTLKLVSELAARWATASSVTCFAPGRCDAALAGYEAQLMEQLSLAQAPARLPTHNPHGPMQRRAWAVDGRVYKPYGEPAFAALEKAACSDVCPELGLESVGPFVSTRKVLLPKRCPASSDLTRETLVELGRFLVRYRAAHRVDRVHERVFAKHCSVRSNDPRTQSFSVDHLVRTSMGLEWWHYTQPTGGRITKVHTESGHWSSVVDMAEVVASLPVELRLSLTQCRWLVDAYCEASGDRSIGARLPAGIIHYRNGIARRLSATRNAGFDAVDAWCRDRQLRIDHARYLLEDYESGAGSRLATP